MTVIGLDVGYSNLKIVLGEAGASPRMLVRPAGAAPLERLGERIGTSRLPDAVVIDVDGRPPSNPLASRADSAPCTPTTPPPPPTGRW